MKRKTGFSINFLRKSRERKRSGYTLLEILVSVSLMLMVMYAVAAIFGRVGSIINETQSTMAMANNLRNVCKRLEKDLKWISVPMSPTRNSLNNEGYFSYIEGLGTSHARMTALHAANSFNVNNVADFIAKDIAWDFDRSEESGTVVPDSTVGDTDDILMFTAKAPTGEYFRGRFLKPVYNNTGVINGCEEVIYESEYAEIVWFLRGTTLYRRTLLILPQEVLEEGLKAADWHAIANGYSLTIAQKDFANNTASIPISPVRLGYGFFRYFDVSVHLDSFDNPTTLNTNYVQRVVANTLGDLSNRKNRYGYWSSMIDDNMSILNFLNGGNSIFSDRSKIHGYQSAWYWLRLPTLQESATIVRNSANFGQSFRAGVPFGYRNDSDATPATNSINPTVWPGWHLNIATVGGLARVDGVSAANLPIIPDVTENSYTSWPFLDFWNAPYCWTGVNSFSGDLTVALNSINENYNDTFLDQDVILTNVISFDVKAWDDTSKQFVSLGANFNLGNKPGGTPIGSFAKDFKTVGRYIPYDKGNGWAYNSRLSFLPAVYDTWSEQYQVEWAERVRNQYDNYNGTYSSAEKTAVYNILLDLEKGLKNIPTNGNVPATSLNDFPPPYDLPMKALQVEIRVFDPRSQNIRNMTFPVEFTVW